jgi:hypothetical protein
VVNASSNAETANPTENPRQAVSLHLSKTSSHAPADDMILETSKHRTVRRVESWSPSRPARLKQHDEPQLTA